MSQAHCGCSGDPGDEALHHLVFFSMANWNKGYVHASKDTVADGWPIVGQPTSLDHDLVQSQIDWRARSPGPTRWAGEGKANVRGGAKVSTACLGRCPGEV